MSTFLKYSENIPAQQSPIVTCYLGLHVLAALYLWPHQIIQDLSPNESSSIENNSKTSAHTSVTC